MKILNTKVNKTTPSDFSSEFFFPLTEASDYLTAGAGEAGKKITIFLTSFNASVVAALTIKLYIGTSPFVKTLFAEHSYTPKVSTVIDLCLDTHIPYSIGNLFFWVSITGGAGDAASTMYCAIADQSAGLDIATVNDASPVSAADIADVILETPENLLATNPNGSVKGAGGGRMS